jgi:hypothetical protein
MRAVLAVVLLLGVAGQAEAGHRCVRTYQTLRSYTGWRNSCLSCHAQSGQSYTHQRYQSGDVANILGGLAKKKTEYQAILSGLEKLGFAPTQGGGYQINGGTYTEGHGYGQQGLTAQGQTVYSNLPHIDVMALGAMSERLASQAQGYGASAVQGAQDLVGQAQQVAAIQAAGIAAAEALKAAQVAPQPSFRQFTFSAQSAAASGAQGSTGVLAPEQPAAGSDLASIVSQSCHGCHNASKAEGGVDFDAFVSLPADQQAHILRSSFERVISSDPSQRMPKGKPELTTEQKAAFAAALVGGQ